MLVDSRLFFISPNWARHLNKINSVTALKKKYVPISLSGKKMELREFDCCVVGEAYGFDSDYTNRNTIFKKDNPFCETCTSISKQFTVFKNETSEKAIPRMEKLIVIFCNHVEKDHQVSLQ